MIDQAPDALSRLIIVVENYTPTLQADHDTNVHATYGYDPAGNLTATIVLAWPLARAAFRQPEARRMPALQYYATQKVIH